MLGGELYEHGQALDMIPGGEPVGTPSLLCPSLVSQLKTDNVGSVVVVKT